jgi:hypothetical protein
MKPELFHQIILEPGIALLERFTGMKPSREIKVPLMAIAGQESNWDARLQVPVAYARSYWQFEQGGGVAGVLAHGASRDKIRVVCAELDIPCDVGTVYNAMAWNDVLALSMARLLIWTDPPALPALGDRSAAWALYMRCWRPGAPHPQTWDARYDKAMELVKV